MIYDIFQSTNLHSGTNCLGIMLGNGWFSEHGFPLAYGKAPKAILIVRIQYPDGTIECIVSDSSWKISPGPITDNKFWGGETYDARFEKDGWTSPAYDDRGWATAAIRDRGRGLMKSQLMPPVRVNETVDPVETRIIRPGIHSYDMGELFGGWALTARRISSGIKKVSQVIPTF